MKQISSFLLFVFSVISLQAETIKINVRSDIMEKDIPCVIIIPDDYNPTVSYPVIYLLHGYGGNQNTWPNMKKDLSATATRDSIIFVCPNGENSWYWDSPINKNSQFETFVSKELISYIDKNYSTRNNSEGRAIAGLSMGGHGALWLAIRHQNTFGAAGSTSGGVDIRPFPENWDMKTQLGEYEHNQEVWNNHTVINQIDKLQNGKIAIIFDCGFQDFFFEVNNNLHAALLKKGIAHDYIVRPGAHDSQYWSNSIDYQILFFKKYFDKFITGK
ncbi:alpha/beta hydrolase [Coprobacter sp.]